MSRCGSSDAGHERWFYIYVSAVIRLSLIAYVMMRETKIDESDSGRLGLSPRGK